MMSMTLPRYVDLDNFRLVANLGQGGMGNVYLARYLGDCLVAVKLVRSEGGPNARELSERFERECRILLELRHPAIVSAYTHGTLADSGSKYLVMEYVAGQTLTALRAARGGPLPADEVARLLLPIADALQYCHEQRVYHRDITPKNILVTDGPAEGAAHARLVDFGASWKDDSERLTRGVVFANIDFQPLERFQAEARDLDPTELGRTVDIFGLAAVAYYLSGGEGPTGAVLSTEQKIGTQPIDVSDPAWSALLTAALHPRRIERTPTMKDFVDALASYLGIPAESLAKTPFWEPSVSNEPSQSSEEPVSLEADRLEELKNLDALRAAERTWRDRIEQADPTTLVLFGVGILFLAFALGWAVQLLL